MSARREARSPPSRGRAMTVHPLDRRNRFSISDEFVRLQGAVTLRLSDVGTLCPDVRLPLRLADFSTIVETSDTRNAAAVTAVRVLENLSLTSVSVTPTVTALRFRPTLGEIRNA